MNRVDAIKTLCREQKQPRVTKAGYDRCKKAVKTLIPDDPLEQCMVLVYMEFRNNLIDDPTYNREGILPTLIG